MQIRATTSVVRKVALGFAMLVTACTSSSSDGVGTARFTTWGEAYIEREIPSADVEDGWTIRYDRFLVVIADVSVGSRGAAPAAKMAGSKLFDMHAPGEKSVVDFTSLPAKAHDHVSYMIKPATQDTALADGATEADKQAMIAGGFSVYVEAKASKGTETIAFRWGFRTSTLYDDCVGAIAGKETEGSVVTNGGTDTIQLTIHGDHLYYDDLQAKEAKLRFDAIASADTSPKDGVVTLDELATVKLAEIPKERGPYGTGSAAGVGDLRQFVEALSRTIGHFRGEGECLASAR